MPEAQPIGIDAEHAIAGTPPLMSVKDMARLLACSTRTIYRLADRGAIPGPARIGGLLRWPRHVVDRWIDDECPSQGA